MQHGKVRGPDIAFVLGVLEPQPRTAQKALVAPRLPSKQPERAQVLFLGNQRLHHPLETLGIHAFFGAMSYN